MADDNKKTAAAVARQVGLDEFYAEVLPEDKANFVRSEKAAGRTVMPKLASALNSLKLELLE